MLSWEFRLVSQYICLLFIRILSIIDLVFCFHVSCVSKWNPRYFNCLICVMCVPFNWIFDGFRFLGVNVIWLHLLDFAFISLSCNHFSIFVLCSRSNVTAFSELACLTSTAISSANVTRVCKSYVATEKKTEIELSIVKFVEYTTYLFLFISL